MGGWGCNRRERVVRRKKEVDEEARASKRDRQMDRKRKM